MRLNVLAFSTITYKDENLENRIEWVIVLSST